MPWLANALLFQLGWFACVLGGANARPWLGTALVSVLIVVHLGWVRHPKPELLLILLTGLLGALLDSTLVAMGLLEFPSGTLLPSTAPHWIIAMWMLFATTLNVSLRWLKGRWLLAGLLGAIAGPLAYYAGAKLGGVSFPAQPALSLLALAMIWCLAMPILTALATRFDGMAGIDRQSDPHTASATTGRPA
jgi:hypothetical protein